MVNGSGYLKTTSLRPSPGNHWLIREIMPFYGLIIQLSISFRFKQFSCVSHSESSSHVITVDLFKKKTWFNESLGGQGTAGFWRCKFCLNYGFRMSRQFVLPIRKFLNQNSSVMPLGWFWLSSAIANMKARKIEEKPTTVTTAGSYSSIFLELLCTSLDDKPS